MLYRIVAEYDRRVYRTAAEVVEHHDEIESSGLLTWQIGCTGGEPFMNPDTIRVRSTIMAAVSYEAECGRRRWQPTIDGLRGSRASRRRSGGTKRRCAPALPGYEVVINSDDPVRLMAFPEMDAAAEMPEITEACWGFLGRSPESVMCATARIVVKRKAAAHPTVLACTLLSYDERFELGPSLAAASGAVRLCVLGGG